MKKLLTIITMALLLTNCGAGLQVVEPLRDTPEPLLSCSVEQVEGGALITCPDGSEVFVANGIDGQDGVDGLDGQDGEDGIDGLFVGYVDPCGDELAHDELLYLDRNGQFHAWFKNVGHVILNEGTRYQTTDGSKCKFEIVNGQVVDNL